MIATHVIAELCLYILTWNVGTNIPRDVDMTAALGLNGTTGCPSNNAPDLYVISFQEVSAKAKDQLFNIFSDDPWTLKVRETLPSDYVKVDTEKLQGILIMLFAKSDHIDHMIEIETQSTKTGFGGLWGNKGAVSIRMSLYGAGVTFIGSHLAAHDDKLKERIEDYNQIVNNHHYTAAKYQAIFDHDFVFWFGDLNFRLTGVDSAWDIRTSVELGKFDELLQRDQLSLVRQTGNAFSLLHENQPTFPPTFKFVEGTSDYDLKRRPAWCDRILYRVQTDKIPDIKMYIDQLSYKSHSAYEISDHKPVSGTFLYKIESQSHDVYELHEMTHGSGGIPIWS